MCLFIDTCMNFFFPQERGRGRYFQQIPGEGDLGAGVCENWQVQVHEKCENKSVNQDISAETWDLFPKFSLMYSWEKGAIGDFKCAMVHMAGKSLHMPYLQIDRGLAGVYNLSEGSAVDVESLQGLWGLCQDFDASWCHHSQRFTHVGLSGPAPAMHSPTDVWWLLWDIHGILASGQSFLGWCQACWVGWVSAKEFSAPLGCLLAFRERWLMSLFDPLKDVGHLSVIVALGASCQLGRFLSPKHCVLGGWLRRAFLNVNPWVT